MNFVRGCFALDDFVSGVGFEVAKILRGAGVPADFEICDASGGAEAKMQRVAALRKVGNAGDGATKCDVLNVGDRGGAIAGTGGLAGGIAGAETDFKVISRAHFIAEETDAFAEVGDEDVEFSVVVVVSDGEAAAVVLLGKDWIERREVMKKFAASIPEKEAFLRLQFAGQGTFELEGIAVDSGEVEPAVGIEVGEFAAPANVLQGDLAEAFGVGDIHE